MNKIIGLLILTVVFWLPTFVFATEDVTDRIFLIIWLLVIYGASYIAYLRNPRN